MIYTRLRSEEECDMRSVEARLREVGTVVWRVGGDVLIASVENGNRRRILRELRGDPRVDCVADVDTPYILSSRDVTSDRSRVVVTDQVTLGGEELVVMAGPCTVETRSQTLGVANVVRDAGARVLRGGAFKPRTSPFSFQGHGPEGLEILREARVQTGLPVISEVMNQRELEAVHDTVDILQVGMRNALNYALLKDIGRLPSRRPVLLKCGIGTTLTEFLCAADYVLSEGNPNVLMCLRGTIGISDARSSLNITDLPLLRRRTHLPIVVDPSHVAGRWDLVPATAAAALVAGADGLLIEVHDDPEAALADGEQSLMPQTFHQLMHRLRHLAFAMGRTMVAPPRPVLRDTEHPLHDLCLEAPAGLGQASPSRCLAAPEPARSEGSPS